MVVVQLGVVSLFLTAINAMRRLGRRVLCAFPPRHHHHWAIKQNKKKNILGNIVTAYFHFHLVDVFFPILRGERK